MKGIILFCLAILATSATAQLRIFPAMEEREEIVDGDHVLSTSDWDISFAVFVQDFGRKKFYFKFFYYRQDYDIVDVQLVYEENRLVGVNYDCLSTDGTSKMRMEYKFMVPSIIFTRYGEEVNTYFHVAIR